MADARPQLNILVCGRTGVGKSSLCNSLVGRKVCEVGDPGASSDGAGLGACTTELNKVTVSPRGIVINIFDSPGLQDGNVKNEKEYVEDMYRKCKDADLVLYCTEMTASRLTPSETTAIGLITKKFGPTIWKRCVCVLTKANCVFIKKIEYHENLFKSFRVKMCSLLKEAGVPEDVSDGLHMVAAGYFDGMNDTESERKILFASERCKADPGPSAIVPVDFIPELWVTCLETVPEASRIRFLQATALGGRIRNPTEDMRKMLDKAAKDLAGKIHDSEDDFVHVHHDDLNPPTPMDLTPNQQWRFKEALVVILGLVLAGAFAAMKAT